MPNINDYLAEIQNAQYGENVRDAIVNALLACYADATGSPESVSALIQDYVNREEMIDGSIESLVRVLGNIGTVVQSDKLTNYTTVDVENSTWTQIDSITLSTGRWLLFYGNYVLQAPTGRWRAIATKINNVNNLPAWGRLDILIPNSSTSATKGSSAKSINITAAEETWYLWADQSSGADLTMYPYMFAINLKGQEVADGETILDQLSDLSRDIEILQGSNSTLSASIVTLQTQHSADVYNIEEEISNNVSILRSSITDLDEKGFTLDEDGYLQFE